MSPAEREQWMNQLAALSWETREPTIYALLDRVEALEAELAAAKAAHRHCGAIVAEQYDSYKH